MPGTNTQAHYENSQITDKKSFITLTPGRQWWWDPCTTWNKHCSELIHVLNTPSVITAPHHLTKKHLTDPKFHQPNIWSTQLWPDELSDEETFKYFYIARVNQIMSFSKIVFNEFSVGRMVLVKCQGTYSQYFIFFVT